LRAAITTIARAGSVTVAGCSGARRVTVNGSRRADGFEIAPAREAFFESADVISLHLPSSSDTRGIVTAADLARMKLTALLVNTNRAPIIEEGALVDALRKRRPGFAAVDVYEQEPVVGAEPPLCATLLRGASRGAAVGWSEP
jgi:D-3-phosphoglycerate dehydrogenase / 2-oxoglutarate reductase